MSEQICVKCGEAWNLSEYEDCPRCGTPLPKNPVSTRAQRLGFGREMVNDEDEGDDVIEQVLHQADRTDRRASAIETFATLAAALGILGGVVLTIMGFESDSSDGGLLIVAGLGSVLLWLLIRSLAVGFAARMTLAAAEARFRATYAED